MFRRIELIHDFKEEKWYDAVEDAVGNLWPTEYVPRWMKHGIMGISTEDVIDAWIFKLRGPNRNIPRNSRFYFTELGWKEVGRGIMKACIKTGQEYRVIAIKETDAQVVWRDKHTGYEVAVQPKRKKS